MKILKVIHGYPMRYNAGSEVYSQTLCHGLAERHEVHVFTREEDAFAPDFNLRKEQDADDRRITLHLVNNPRLKDRYRADGIDQRFAEVMDEVCPDIVHVGHLNHLSTSLLEVAASRKVPIVFTLHDYWLMCPRGQFMQMFPKDEKTLWAVCDGQDDRKCAERCYSRYFSGAPDEAETDIRYWTDWVSRRMNHVREMAGLVDVFVAPARYLRDRFRNDFGLPEEKLIYLDYGFDRTRMNERQRKAGEPFTFGYIGTHIPAKGIHDLIRAFGLLKGDVRLRIWGRPRGQDTDSLKRIAEDLPEEVRSRVEWRSEYRNQEIVTDVFNHCDAIVVPSIWMENSPLVIHEAQQAKVPVVTADVGGMAEYVHHEVNGLLFQHRSVASMAKQMQRLVDSPEFAKELGRRGYPFSDDGEIPSIEQHVRDIERLYERLLEGVRSKESMQRNVMSGESEPSFPWRITFDTNPDTCNLNCIMCEEFSPYSESEKERRRVVPIGNGGTDVTSRRKQGERVMPFQLIEKVVEEAAPKGLREIIPSTMGEPLLYKDFDKILDLCERKSLKLNLTTNGTFPKGGVKKWAPRIVRVTSDVKISWNGASKETHEEVMRGAKWEKVLNNVREFIRIRDEHAASGGNCCRVTFQLTFLEKNVGELPDIVKLAIDLGVDRVKGHHLWAHFKEIEDQSLRRSAESIERWNQAVKKAQEVVEVHRLPNGKKLLLENIFPLDPDDRQEIAPDAQCPFLGKEAWVNAEGRFDPCCAPDEQRKGLGYFGKLQDQSLGEIWGGEAYRSLVANYREKELCKGCNMRMPMERA